MINQKTFTDQLEQIRNLDVRAELKKLDVLDISGNFEKLDLPTVDFSKMDLSMSALPDPGDVRAKFETIVKDFVDTASGFALVTRRDIESLETRIAAAEKAAKAPVAKKAAAKRTVAKATASK